MAGGTPEITESSEGLVSLYCLCDDGGARNEGVVAAASYCSNKDAIDFTWEQASESRLPFRVKVRTTRLQRKLDSSLFQVRSI